MLENKSHDACHAQFSRIPLCVFSPSNESTASPRRGALENHSLYTRPLQNHPFPRLTHSHFSARVRVDPSRCFESTKCLPTRAHIGRRSLYAPPLRKRGLYRVLRRCHAFEPVLRAVALLLMSGGGWALRVFSKFMSSCDVSRVWCARRRRKR